MYSSKDIYKDANKDDLQEEILVQIPNKLIVSPYHIKDQYFDIN